MKPASAHDCWQTVLVKKRPTVPLHEPSKFKPRFVAGFDAILHVVSPSWSTKGVEITSVQESEHDDGGGSKGEVQHGGSA